MPLHHSRFARKARALDSTPMAASPEHLRLPEQPLGLTQLARQLRWCMPSTYHESRSPAPMLGHRTPIRTDRTGHATPTTCHHRPCSMPLNDRIGRRWTASSLRRHPRSMNQIELRPSFNYCRRYSYLETTALILHLTWSGSRNGILKSGLSFLMFTAASYNSMQGFDGAAPATHAVTATAGSATTRGNITHLRYHEDWLAPALATPPSVASLCCRDRSNHHRMSAYTIRNSPKNKLIVVKV